MNEKWERRTSDGSLQLTPGFKQNKKWTCGYCYAEHPNKNYVEIDDLDLATRTRNALKNANIDSLKELRSVSDEELLALRNFGEKSLEDLHWALEWYEHGHE